MNLNEKFNNQVRIRHLDQHGAVVGEIVAKNTFTHAMATIIMNAMLKSGPSQITYLYARFSGASSSNGPLSPPNSDLTLATRATFIASSDSATGGLWVPLLATPIQSSSNPALYTGNTATFSFRIPGNISASQTSPAHWNATTSYIYALGLAVAVSATDRTQDIIVSTLQSFAPFQVPSAGQESVDYPLLMNI